MKNILGFFVTSFALSSGATAAITQYSSHAAFQSATGPLSVQDFESFASASGIFRGVAFDFGDFSGFNGANTGSAFGGDILSPGSVNGSTEIFGVVKIGAADFVLTFDAPIYAIGFDCDNLADQRTDHIIFNNAQSDVVVVTDPIDQVRFWGFVSDTPFTTFTIRLVTHSVGGSPTDGFTIDDLCHTPVPSPGGAGLVLLALPIVTRRRR